MATKLKIFNPVLKIIVFILIAALSVTMVLKIISVSDSDVWGWAVEDIGKDDYTKTQKYWWYINSINNNFQELREALAGRASPGAEAEINSLFYNVEWSLREELFNEYIEQELTHEMLWEIFERDYKNDIKENVENLFYNLEWELKQTLINRGVDEDEITDEMLREIFELDYAARIANAKETLFNSFEWDLTENMKEEWNNKIITSETLWGNFRELYSKEIDGINHNAKYSLERWVDRFNHYEGIVYYIEVGETIHQNTDLNYEQIQQKYFGRVTGESSHDGEEFERYIFAFTDEFIAEQNLMLAQINNEVREMLTFSAVWLALYLLFSIYLIFSAGRKTSEPGIKTYSIDKVFSEIPLILVVLTITGGFFWTAYLYELSNHIIFMYIYIGVLTLFFALAYALLSIIIRQIKNRSFIKSFLVFKILKFIWEQFSKTFKGIGGGIHSLFSKQNPMIKATLIVLALGLLTMIPFVGFITVPYMLFVIYKYVNKFKLIKQGVKTVKSGVYNEKIDVQGDSEFALLADDINSIAAGLSEEVERRIKSERLKTELIVNVSHDIRTPLTSLITYADLLKNEETDNENIAKYAEIISQKSEKLKILTDDLFESSKAASGNITVSLGDVEINSLLIQALAEFDDKIRKSNLEFKLNIPEEKVMVHADGGLLWRVIENLMSNTLKYSLENSRVYIDVGVNDNHVLIEMKNISKSELNIPEDEVAERFKRGDLSRNSEGSGLGLDIASSLMRCQSGGLNIKIDGDLFKVCIRIPKIAG